MWERSEKWIAWQFHDVIQYSTVCSSLSFFELERGWDDERTQVQEQPAAAARTTKQTKRVQAIEQTSTKKARNIWKIMMWQLLFVFDFTYVPYYCERERVSCRFYRHQAISYCYYFRCFQATYIPSTLLFGGWMKINRIFYFEIMQYACYLYLCYIQYIVSTQNTTAISLVFLISNRVYLTSISFFDACIYR